MQTYVAQRAGEGVHFKGIKLSKKILSRIEALGKMNDRRKACLGARDKDCLMELAARYAEKNMPKMAAEVAKEAELIGK
jgi:hypothetical protein